MFLTTIAVCAWALTVTRDVVAATHNAAHIAATPALPASAESADASSRDLPDSNMPNFGSVNAIDGGQAAWGATPGHFPFTYLDVGLSFGDATGLAVLGSYHLRENWFLSGQLGYLSESAGPVDVSLTTFSFGGGYAHEMQPGLALLASAELEYGRVSASFGASRSDTEFGLRARGGARWQATPELEVFGGLGFRTIFSGDFLLDAGALYAFNSSWSAIGKLELGEYNQFTLGVRCNF